MDETPGASPADGSSQSAGSPRPTGLPQPLPADGWYVDVVGMHGGLAFGAAAAAAIEAADVIFGAPRHLDTVRSPAAARRVPFDRSLERTVDEAADLAAAGRKVVLLTSGDPGFFGLVRLASRRLSSRDLSPGAPISDNPTSDGPTSDSPTSGSPISGSLTSDSPTSGSPGFPQMGPSRLRVHPAPSAVSLAFARLARRWDDAVVVSAHGRPGDPALDAVEQHPKVAVLVGPALPPELLGALLVGRHCRPRDVAVCGRLGQPDEEVTLTDLPGLAARRWDPMSVVVFTDPAAPLDDGEPGTCWSGPLEAPFEHRAGMITKPEVRAVVLAKLELPERGVLWDVGAGSGSVAIDAARMCPGLAVYAVERRNDDVGRIERNAAGTGVVVVAGEAPAALDGLPEPDCVFVGGGGLDVLRAARSLVAAGGTTVATFAAMDRAMAAARLLGNLVQISVSRAVPVGSAGSLRLAADNPVFVCWGHS